MSSSSSPAKRPGRIESIKIKAKLLQKAKKKAGLDYALKDAFETLAKNAGYTSWREFRVVLEQGEALRPPSSLWHVWYSTYEEAKAHQTANGGYLVPYEKHFFIADENYLRTLGFEADDPVVRAVGSDWAKPQDSEAWGRLLKRLK